MKSIVFKHHILFVFVFLVLIITGCTKHKLSISNAYVNDEYDEIIMVIYNNSNDTIIIQVIKIVLMLFVMNFGLDIKSQRKNLN